MRDDAPTITTNLDEVEWPKDGDKVHIPNGLLFHGCCDCGLVHRMRITLEGGEFYLQFWRDDRATEEWRLRHNSHILEAVQKHNGNEPYAGLKDAKVCDNCEWPAAVKMDGFLTCLHCGQSLELLEDV